VPAGEREDLLYQIDRLIEWLTAVKANLNAE
jgi:hypothetical protein